MMGNTYYIYVTDRSRDTLWIIDPSDYSKTEIAVGEGPLGVAVSPDGSHVYVSNRDDNTVSVVKVNYSNPGASEVNWGRVGKSLTG